MTGRQGRDTRPWPTLAHVGASVKSIFCPKLFNTMQGETRERWRRLCVQAETEEDPEKLIDIFRDIIGMLDEKAARLFAEQMREEVGSKPN